MDNTLRMIGLALRAGRLEAGEEPVGQACREKDCRLILAAADAAGGRPTAGAGRKKTPGRETPC